MWESDNLEVGTGESESLATATWYTGVGAQVARRKIREALCLHTNVGLQRWASLTGLGNTYPYAISSSFRITSACSQAPGSGPKAHSKHGPIYQLCNYNKILHFLKPPSVLHMENGGNKNQFHKAEGEG